MDYQRISQSGGVLVRGLGAGAIKFTGEHKLQQLPDRVPHLKERTYVCGFLAKQDGP
jgi:hypothetical protein